MMVNGVQPNGDELTGLMAQFDISADEARAYLLVASMSNLEASSIARMLSIKRSTIYPVLRSLDEKGLIETLTKGVNRYRALPLEPYMESRMRQANERVRIMEGSREKLESALVPAQDESSAGKTRFIGQRAQLARLIKSIIQESKSELFFYINDRRVRQISEHYVGAVKVKPVGGVTTRVLVNVNDANREFVDRLTEFAEVRHTETNPVITFILRDSEEAILVRPTPEIMDFEYFQDYAIWTDDRSLTQTFQSMLGQLWDSAGQYRGDM